MNNGLHRGLVETFGGKGTFQLSWLIPTNITWIDKDDIMGYTREACERVGIVISDIEQGGRVQEGEMRRARVDG